MVFLELTEDQMVEELAEIQRCAREMFIMGMAQPYSKTNHERSVEAVMKKLKWLAYVGDVV